MAKSNTASARFALALAAAMGAAPASADADFPSERDIDALREYVSAQGHQRSDDALRNIATNFPAYRPHELDCSAIKAGWEGATLYMREGHEAGHSNTQDFGRNLAHANVATVFKDNNGDRHVKLMQVGNPAATGVWKVANTLSNAEDRLEAAGFEMQIIDADYSCYPQEPLRANDLVASIN